jgi:hypothetical protein
MPLVKLLEGRHVALSRLLRQRVIRFLLRLGFGCGHVFVLGQATKELYLLTLLRHNYHEFACSKSGNLFLGISHSALARCVVALNAGVMRRFERVVALPDPKDIEFPQPHRDFP